MALSADGVRGLRAGPTPKATPSRKRGDRAHRVSTGAWLTEMQIGNRKSEALPGVTTSDVQAQSRCKPLSGDHGLTRVLTGIKAGP